MCQGQQCLEEKFFSPSLSQFLKTVAARRRDNESQSYLPVWGAPFYERLDISGSKSLSVLKRMTVPAIFGSI